MEAQNMTINKYKTKEMYLTICSPFILLRAKFNQGIEKCAQVTLKINNITICTIRYFDVTCEVC